MFLPPRHIFEFFPEYRSTQTPWQQLTPVAAWLVHDLHPARIVELGSYRGDSFFAFLQAAAGEERVKDLVSIDSWEGDQHTGAYGNTVYRQFASELAGRNDPRARAIQGYFSDAVSLFEDGSIDLLHIDGAHDYISVKADFETWLPKMATDGVVLFHDTMVRSDDFGVWQLWAELEEKHPGRCFNLAHSNGLGILCLGESTQGQVRCLGRLEFCNAIILQDVLQTLGRRVTDLTGYEHALMTRNGGEVPEDHVFSRGEIRQSLEMLRQLEMGAVRPDDLLALRAALEDRQDRKEQLALQEIRNDLAALRAALEDRQDRKEQLVLHDIRSNLAALRAALEDRQDCKEQLALQEIRNDLATLRAALEDRQDRKEQFALQEIRNDLAVLRAALEDRQDRKEQFVLHDIRSAAQIKNDAQDDALIYMSEKIEAHEEALREMGGYLRRISQHPVFR